MIWSWQETVGDTKVSLLREVTLAIERVLGRSAENPRAAVQPMSLLGADLGLSSIAVARLAGLLQKRCGRKPLPFHTLFVRADGTMLQDIRVTDLVSFLEQHLRADKP